MQNPPVRPISVEQQLRLETEMLRGEVQKMMSRRAEEATLTLGAVMDGIAFTLQRAKSQDPEQAAIGNKDLRSLQELLARVMQGEWDLSEPASSRIVIPR